MEHMLHCLVDRGGRVYVAAIAQSYGDVAAQFGLDEATCDEYRFDLETRSIRVDKGSSKGLSAVREYLGARLGSPGKLMNFARAGGLTKESLASLLAPGSKRAYLTACAAIEKAYTDQCAPSTGACLESGCSVEGEVCLQPLLRAGADYHKACGAEWVKLFGDPANRVDAWKN